MKTLIAVLMLTAAIASADDHIDKLTQFKPGLETSLSFCMKMAKDEDVVVRVSTAQHCSSFRQVLLLLAIDKSVDVRCEVASYLSDADDLRTMANDSSSRVLVWVAHNKNTPRDVLKTLSEYPDAQVKEMAIANLTNREAK